MVIVGSILSEDALPPPPFPTEVSYFSMGQTMLDCQVIGDKFRKIFFNS